MIKSIDDLRKIKIKYYHDFKSENRIFAPFVIFTKRFLRRILRFIILPVIDEINEYHSYLIDVIEMQLLSGNKEPVVMENSSNILLMHQHHVEELSGYCTGDVELISKFADRSAKPLAGYYTDFAGIRTSPAALSYLETRVGTVCHNLPFPDDTFHAPTIEYSSLYYAVEYSEDTFTMFELGAGWGTWMAYAAKACKARGFKRVNVIGIEGAKNKIPVIIQHLSVNDLRDDSSDLAQFHNGVYSSIINGVVDIDDGVVFFPETLIDDYDATVLESESTIGKKKNRIPSYSIRTLVNDFAKIDLIHFDIQGHEYNVIESSIKVLTDKVRFMCIATHSRKIEGDLIELLSQGKWQLLRESPCLFSKEGRENLIDRTTKDGTQLWMNTSGI